MNKFEKKIEKMKQKLESIEYIYGHDNYRAFELRKKIKLYESVSAMSNQEVNKQLAYTAGEVAKAKIVLGDYPPYSFAVEERKLLKVLTERIKAEKKVQRKENKQGQGDLIEIGCSVDDVHGGMEC